MPAESVTGGEYALVIFNVPPATKAGPLAGAFMFAVPPATINWPE